jgi:3-oxoacyl-[acyl-carrier protein] reductase
MKTVWVTGGARGLGLAITERLLRDGYKVVAIGRNETEDLARLRSEHAEACVFRSYDLNDVDGIKALVDTMIAAHGAPYGVVNNAGVGSDGVLATMHNSDIERVMRVNAIAPMILVKYLVRPMLRAREGRIVNISSIIASTGFSGLAAYAASKAALEGFTRSLAREVGRVGVTVNCVAPGYMATDMTAGLQGEKLQSITRRSPLGRLAEPADAAGAVAYLIGPDGKNVTGTILTVDAGSTA